MLGASTEIQSRHSDNSTVNMPHSLHAVSPNSPREALPVLEMPTVLPVVKEERLDPIIELSTESEGESPNVNTLKQSCSVRIASHETNIVESLSGTPSKSLSKSSMSLPPPQPHVLAKASIMECLKRLASMHCSRNELSTMDLNNVKHQRVPFLPPIFDGDVIFELPP